MQVKSSLYGAIKCASVKHSLATCMYYKGKKVSYDKFLSMIDDFANGLKYLGIKSNDVVTICAPNTVESIVSFYAVNKIGAIAHMVHPLMQKEALKANMETVNTKCLIILNTSLESYDELIKVLEIPVVIINPARILGITKSLMFKKMQHIPSYKKYYNCYSFESLMHKKEIAFADNNSYKSTAVLLNSGGSSGEPKIIELSAYAMNSLVSEGSSILNLPLDQVEGNYMLAVLPMFHGFGLCMGVHAMLANGGAINVMPKFHPGEVIKYLKRKKVNYIIGVPALYEALLSRSAFDGKILRNLKECFIGGDFVSPNLLHRFNKKMEENGSICRLYEGYGLTETVTVCTVNTHEHHKEGSVGHGLESVDIKIVDENNNPLPANTIGEIVVGGETLMIGYKNGDNPFIRINDNRYVKTGDLGYLDKDGYLFFKQRIKRLLKVKGVNVFPSEVEKIVTDYDDVKDACLVSCKSDELRLYIVLNNGFNENIDLRVKEDIKKNVSPLAVPHEIVYLKYMPQTKVAKINYKMLEDYNYSQN